MYTGNMTFNLCVRDCGFRVKVTGNQIPGKHQIFTVGKIHLPYLRPNFDILAFKYHMDQ